LASKNAEIKVKYGISPVFYGKCKVIFISAFEKIEMLDLET